MSNQVRAVASLALLYAFRMLGLFMVLPVLVLYGADYAGATPFYLGLALGIYGLTQGVFQIPLGSLSDLVGRKPVIIAGLLVFAVGSFVAASATNVYELILGRALQGAGAIAATVMAMVADLTSEKNRTKAMAAIGASIGLAFTVAMILGPAVAASGGLKSVFYVALGLALLGVVIVLWVVPTPVRLSRNHRDTGAIPALIKSTAKNLSLQRLNFGVFVLHLVLMASFVAFPAILEATLDLDRARHWVVYLPVLLLAFIAMFPFILVAEKKQKVKNVLIGAIAVLLLSFVGLIFSNQVAGAVIAFLFTFFVAFNLLEATLPSLVSKISPVGAKGTAMGLFSTSQFLGAFVGGAGGGWLVQNYGYEILFAACAIVSGAWIVIAMTMPKPRHLSSMCLSLDEPPVESELLSVPGVVESLWDKDESLLYLKVDKVALDHKQLDSLIYAEPA